MEHKRVCLCVCVRRRNSECECWILSVCVKEKDSVANRCQANCHLAGPQCFFIALAPQKEESPPPLPICLYILIVFCGVLYFLHVLIPHLEDELLFFRPQLLWQPLFASKKVRLRGQKKVQQNALALRFT